MKPLLPLLLLSALLPQAAPADTPAPADSSDSVYVLLRDFENEFALTQRTLGSNVPDTSGNVRTVYDLYRELSDEEALLRRGIIRARRPGRYATAQDRISFYPLPADSTLERVEAYLLALDSLPDPSAPCPEAFREVDVLLHGTPRELRKFVVSNFRPALKAPADSVVYLTPSLQAKLTDCLRMAWEKGLPDDVIRRINALMPVKRGTWGGLRIVKPIVVNYILLETCPDPHRAYVSVLNDDSEVYGILFFRDGDGWRIRTARMLGKIVS